jgi:hypothetical protein
LAVPVECVPLLLQCFWKKLYGYTRMIHTSVRHLIHLAIFTRESKV